ncbi:MarR family transcriptional regulator, transcriptional regulator for hemolysin [Oryzomicrobium terrae]|uniref:MarR family transcriptional regulator, transcriptional regulator for hemolysin n=1 Tax=Oryzomicrobium terrae TaxID=1735038 RepID=A0A5C1E8W6_9RHOO|nr:MarR family transcriptional regulator [Oryzomicrobium terrae]QEL65310.1 MarR family transcriptional regulator, transcriptional regulator for hemolysin [Oryzomicrobium terrae]
MDNLPQRFAFLLHRTASLYRQALDQRLKPTGLSQATWRALLILRNRHAPMNQTELAGRLAIEGPTLVRLLDRLERQGWVLRSPDPQDRRSKLLSLTDEGLALTEGLQLELDGFSRELLAGINEAALGQCTEVLDQVFQLLQARRA